MRTTLDAILTGTPKPLGHGQSSAIDKRPVRGAVAIGDGGLAGDEQADRRVHGRPEKAALFYPADHYPCWRTALPELAPKFVPGGFGENLSARGLSEETVLIGELWRVGSALLQVAQGRQPCWKLAARFGITTMVGRVLENGRAGWYFRVVEPGIVSAGDAMTLIDRPDHGWTVRRVYDALLRRIDR